MTPYRSARVEGRTPGERGRNPYALALGAVALHVLTALMIFMRV